LRRAIKDADSSTNIAALQVIAMLQTDGKPLVADLTRLAIHNDVNVRCAAMRALGFVEIKTTIPLIMRVAETDRDQETRVEAIRSLGHFGDAAFEAVPLLAQIMSVELMNGKDNMLGNQAATALTCIGTRAVPALRRILDDASQCERARSIAVSSLGLIGSDASAAVPSLIHALQDSSFDIRWRSILSLSQIRHGGPMVIEALLYTAADKNVTIRRGSIETLVKLDSKNTNVLALLRGGLTDNDNSIRILCCNSLGGLRSGGRTAVPELIECLNDKDNSVRIAAAQALGKIGRAATNAIPALTQMALDRNAKVSESALAALREIETKKSTK
jgi:HEAT repeat protein